MQNHLKVGLAVCLVIVLALAAPAMGAGLEGELVYVPDADTLVLKIDGRKQTVRLVGVDAPETRHSKGLKSRARRMHRSKNQEAGAGEAARDWLNSQIAKGEVIRLEYDRIQPKRDRYGRLLAYAYDSKDRLLNELVIRQGYALAMRKFKCSKRSEFIRLEKQAKAASKGLWTRGRP